MSILTATQLQELAQYDTPTVCNAIELFEVRPATSGYMDGRIRAGFPELPPMVGYAATATFRSAAPAIGDVYDAMDAQLAIFESMPSTPVVVIQDLDSPSQAATFGEIMCTTYRRFGAGGIITSGSGRDLDQIRALDFPVFTNGSVCAHGYCHLPTVDVPVHVGGVTIAPGDLLHGDCNGVTTIPAAIASELADVCGAFVEAEKLILNALGADDTTRASLNAARAEFRATIAQLRQRISRKQG